MIKVLFVCSGNVFRSLSAEYSLRNFAKKNNLKIKVSSAGIKACKSSDIDSIVITTLKKFKIDPTKHKPRQISKKIIDENDLIIAMSINHQKYIEEHFGIKVPLFNEVTLGKKTKILDNNEVKPKLVFGTKRWDEYNSSIVKYIHNLIPNFANNYEKFLIKSKTHKDCKFCDFIIKKTKKHNCGFPFLILNETKHTISFLSEDVPKGKDVHVLVIPKKHHDCIENLPKEVQHDLIEHIALNAKAIRETHGACNILQNDGKSAGQTVFHVHFHLIPRDEKDNIEIELYKRKTITIEQFKNNHNRLKNKIQELSK